jgi:hypothetical protein
VEILNTSGGKIGRAVVMGLEGDNAVLELEVGGVPNPGESIGVRKGIFDKEPELYREADEEV